MGETPAGNLFARLPTASRQLALTFPRHTIRASVPKFWDQLKTQTQRRALQISISIVSPEKEPKDGGELILPWKERKQLPQVSHHWVMNEFTSQQTGYLITYCFERMDHRVLLRSLLWNTVFCTTNFRTGSKNFLKNHPPAYYFKVLKPNGVWLQHFSLILLCTGHASPLWYEDSTHTHTSFFLPLHNESRKGLTARLACQLVIDNITAEIET